MTYRRGMNVCLALNLTSMPISFFIDISDIKMQVSLHQINILEQRASA